MNVTCGDSRFKVIEKAKDALVSGTNIQSSPDEMAVLDNILFRAWQMGWLKEYETDYKQRMKDEYWQLKTRYDKLHETLVAYGADKLDFELPYNLVPLLHEQKEAMRTYLDILEIRAKIEGVKL